MEIQAKSSRKFNCIALLFQGSIAGYMDVSCTNAHGPVLERRGRTQVQVMFRAS
jgi:hypothetical protein